MSRYGEKKLTKKLRKKYLSNLSQLGNIFLHGQGKSGKNWGISLL